MPSFLVLRMAGGSHDRRIAAVWSRWALRCLGLRIEIDGAPMNSGMLAVNHASWLDPLVIGAAAHAFFVAKREVRSWPGIGPLCRLGRVEFFDRRRSEAARQSQSLGTRLRSGQLLCVFPEGTTTDGLRVLPFRSTVFAPLFDGDGERFAQPVAVHYQPDSSRGLVPDFYSWWGEATFAEHMWSVLTQSSGGTVRVSFLAPARAADFANRKTLARHCEAAVDARLRELAAAAYKG